jgi:hypothetical protein
MFLKLYQHIERNYLALIIVFICISLFSIDSRVSAGELITQIKFLANPSAYSYDIILSNSISFNARFYLVHLLFFVSEIFNISPEILLILLNRVVHFIVLYSFYLISQHILGSIVGGLISLVVLIFFSICSFNFASFSLWSGQLNAQSFFYVCYLGSIYSCFKGNFNFALILLGIGSLFHFLLGGIYFIFLIFSIYFFRFKNNLLMIHKIFPGFLIGAMFLVASIFPFFYGQNIEKIFSDNDFIDAYVFQRHPHHYLISSFGAGDWLFICAIFLAIYLYKSIRIKEIKRNLVFIIIPLVLSLLLLPIFYFFVEVIPNRVIASLSLTRFVSHGGLLLIPVMVSSLFLRNFKKFNLSKFVYRLPVKLVLIFIALGSFFYDLRSDNHEKLDFLRYELLNQSYSKEYLFYRDLKNACSWIKNHSNKYEKIISPGTEARYLCERSMIGGSTFPFSRDDQVIIDWIEEKSIAGMFFSHDSYDCSNLSLTGLDIAIIPKSKKLSLNPNYSNESFFVIKINQQC